MNLLGEEEFGNGRERRYVKREPIYVFIFLEELFSGAPPCYYEIKVFEDYVSELHNFCRSYQVEMS